MAHERRVGADGGCYWCQAFASALVFRVALPAKSTAAAHSGLVPPGAVLTRRRRRRRRRSLTRDVTGRVDLVAARPSADRQSSRRPRPSGACREQRRDQHWDCESEQQWTRDRLISRGLTAVI